MEFLVTLIHRHHYPAHILLGASNEPEDARAKGGMGRCSPGACILKKKEKQEEKGSCPSIGFLA